MPRGLFIRHGMRLVVVAIRRYDAPFLAWFLPVDARPGTQPFQGGFVAAIGTEPVVADGRTCL